MTATVERAIGRRPFIMLTTGALGAAVAGCRRSTDRAYARGNTVIMGVLGVNDIKPTGRAGSIVFSPFTARDEHHELTPRLAQSWTHSPDYMEWTYHLRRGVRWHDGVPVTAHDVKFTLDLLSHPDVDEYRFDAVTALDDYTVKVRLPRVESDWGDSINADIVFYPRHLLEHLDPMKFRSWDFWTHPVGSGPYRFVRYLPETMIEYEANPEYFRGEPKIKHLVLKFVGREGLIELLSGQIDVVASDIGSSTEIPMVLADPRFRVYSEILPLPLGIYWKSDDPLFADPRVRRALTLALDRGEFLRALSLPVDEPQSDGVFMPRVLFGGKLPPPLPYDPAEANALLDAAGWHDRDTDGVRHGNGRAFHFTLLVPNIDFRGPRSLAVLVQAQLRRVGVQMEIQLLDLSVLRERTKVGQFEAALEISYPWSDRQRADFGRGNAAGYANPEAFRLLDAAVAATNPDQLDSIYRELTAVYRADLPATRLVNLAKTTFAHRRVRGQQPFLAWPERHIEDLWLDDRGT